MAVNGKCSHSLNRVAFVSDALTRAPHMDALINLIVDQILDIFKPEYISLMHFERRSLSLRREIIAGERLKRTAKPRLALARDIEGSIDLGGEILALPEIEDGPFLILFDVDQDHQCELRIPFFIENQGIGVINLGRKESGQEYSAEEIDLLRILVNHLTIRSEAKCAAHRGTATKNAGALQPQITQKGRDPGSELLGVSPAMEQVRELIRRVAGENIPVLISGESGTGKELVARAIHRLNLRGKMALVTMNCAALPESLVESELFGHEKGSFTGAIARKKGKFELADRSTLFLDEIGDMQVSTQAKLLRVLQDGTFQRVGGNDPLHADVRLIAATNKDLGAMIRNGTFREDLYYRINVIQIQIPPLRQRREDVVVLAEYFFDHYNNYYRRNLRGFSPEVQSWMKRYAFPGNVRELKNIVERAVIMEKSDRITMEMMPGENGSPENGAAVRTRHLTLEQLEAEHVRDVLQQVGYNKSAAARLLGIARKTLREKCQKYNISPEETP